MLFVRSDDFSWCGNSLCSCSVQEVKIRPSHNIEVIMCAALMRDTAS